MLKILQIDRKNESEKTLYKNIVTFNNSQNSIDEKTFVANTGIFNRLKNEFENKGFLLLIKQSDKNSFKSKYTQTTKLKEKSVERIKKFDLEEAFEKTADYFIPLEKLLQVIAAFSLGGYQAYTKKSNLLRYSTSQYNDVIKFIKNSDVTVDSLIDLYLLYKKADIRKSISKENRFPIPYYLIDAFALYDCDGRKPSNISNSLSDTNKINDIIRIYTLVTKAYTKSVQIEYNQMIKKPLDYQELDKQRDIYQE